VSAFIPFGKVYRVAAFLLVCSAALHGFAQASHDDHWEEAASFDYGIGSDITYGDFNNVPVRLDVWSKPNSSQPAPVLFYIHGGGWVMGNKIGAANMFLPYLERGWDVVNVEYRMAGSSLAPAAVQDVRCALRWVYRNSATYHFDTTHIVASGHSAGGHLALMAGMLPGGTDLDSQCPAGPDEPPLKVAAVVNWYGISDVADLLQGPDIETYAIAWIGAQPEKQELARHVSPLTYVRAGLPPIITIHGDHDPTVPYSQAVRLRDALTRAGDTNQLVTIPGGGHGSFNDEQTIGAFKEVWNFLDAQGVVTRVEPEVPEHH
jgi:acetyl esterase/lipase